MTDIVNRWTVADSAELYDISRWGAGYIGIGPTGNLLVHPDRDPERAIDVMQFVEGVQSSGMRLPLLIRFGGILEDRLREMHRYFARAIREYEYSGSYRCVYPIKVNQQRQVIEEVIRCGRPYGFGLEAGSKAELVAMVSLADNETPLICNGFKDEEYLRIAMLAHKMGRQVIPVIDRMSDLSIILRQADIAGVRPMMGVRAKLAARGAGRWQTSGGYLSKFGLTINEVLQVIEQLERCGLSDCLKMVHFHLGSQVTNIRHIKTALIESARIYTHLYRRGAGLQLLDVGGGLGIDYDGSQTDFSSSVNYTLEEYANDVVYHVQTVCDHADVPHPDLISESGRAVVGYQSLLVFETLGVNRQGDRSAARSAPPGNAPLPICQLHETLTELQVRNARESFHDAQQALDTAITLFNTGHVDLEQRAQAEELFWAICRRARTLIAEQEDLPDELSELDRYLSDTYFVNFSLFQSLPDSWAVKQLFPVMPIHRLDERPSRSAVIADVTCDSDGKIDRFIDRREVRRTLPVHARNGEPYLMAAFLVGAYQEILGDLHNLFGDTHALHVDLADDGQVVIKSTVRGDTVSEVLQYVGFSVEQLADQLRRSIAQAQAAGRFDSAEATACETFFLKTLAGYTYLEQPTVTTHRPAGPGANET